MRRLLLGLFISATWLGGLASFAQTDAVAFKKVTRLEVAEAPLVSETKTRFGSKTYHLRFPVPTCIGDSLPMNADKSSEQFAKGTGGWAFGYLKVAGKYVARISGENSPNATWVFGGVSFYDDKKLLWTRGGVQAYISEKAKRVLVMSQAGAHFEIVSFDGKSLFVSKEGCYAHFRGYPHYIVYDDLDTSNPKQVKHLQVIRDWEGDWTYPVEAHYDQGAFSGGLGLLSGDCSRITVFDRVGNGKKTWVVNTATGAKRELPPDLDPVRFVKDGRVLIVADAKNKKYIYMDSDSGKEILKAPYPPNPLFGISEDGELMLCRTLPDQQGAKSVGQKSENLFVYNLADDLLWKMELPLTDLDARFGPGELTFQDDKIAVELHQDEHDFQLKRFY